MREPEDVDCDHAHECFGGGHFGKGCYSDDLSSAMGGKPWVECRCMTKKERSEAGLDKWDAEQKKRYEDAERNRPEALRARIALLEDLLRRTISLIENPPDAIEEWMWLDGDIRNAVFAA